MFTQSSDGYCVKFFPAQPITATDLATLTERVRCRVVRWSRMQRLLDADAAAAMLRRENSGVSVDASVRITLIDRDVPSYFQSLEYLLRYRARPPFALERLSVRRGEDGRISRGIAPLADIPDREGGDGGPELVIRGEHPVIAMPVLPRRRHEIGQPVQEVKRQEFDDATGARPCGLPPASRANPVRSPQ